MAQIKDLIVLGAARILNKIYASEFIGKLTGNADTATKATQDESGNNIKSSYASSISISDHTITLKNKNGASLGTVNVPDTNTWRGIQDNLTSTSTTDSLSANQGRLLANGSARDSTKLPLSGGTLTGTLRIKCTTSNFCEGIRIQNADSKWCTIALGGTSDAGTGENVWSIHRKDDNNFSISRNSPDGANGLVMTSTGMGLGTTSPGERLEVVGNVKVSSNIYPKTDNSGDVGTSSNKWANMYATSFHGALSGNATTATKLATARTIALTGSVTGSGTFDGSGNLSIATTTNHTHSYAGSSSAGGAANSLSYFKNTSTTNVGIDDTSANAIGYVSDTSSILNQNDGAIYKQVYSGSWVHEIYGDYRTGQIAVRGKNDGTWQAWRKILDSSNYKSYCTPANIGAAASSHTHSYAGSSSAGGSATSAVKLDSSAGSATQPVYFSGGKPVACTYTLGKSVPSDAIFTDTNTWRGIQDNLTSTSTTDSLSANQGRILANGGAKDSTKLPLSGGTMSGTAFISWPDSGNWSNSNSGVTFPVKRGGLEWNGQSDYIQMYSEETASDNLELVIKFGDDNSNGISIRNSSGVQTARISATGVFTGSLSGNATTATSAVSVVDYNNSSRAIKIGYDGAGATTSNLAYIAGYLTSGTQIKDVSKSVLKSWLNIDALVGYATGVCTAGTQTVTPVSGAKYVLAVIWVPHTTSIGSGDCNIGTSMLTGNEYMMIDARYSNYALIVKTTTDNKVIISVPDNCHSFTSYQYTIFTFK